MSGNREEYLAHDGYKVCTGCIRKGREARHPVSDFHKNRVTKDGLQTWCMLCTTERRHEFKRFLAAHHPVAPICVVPVEVEQPIEPPVPEVLPPLPRPIQVHASPTSGARVPKVHPETYQKLLRAQGGMCICGNPETMVHRGEVQQLRLYYNAQEMVIRALLCFKCNLVMELAHDDPEILSRLAALLRQARVMPLLSARAHQ